MTAEPTPKYKRLEPLSCLSFENSLDAHKFDDVVGKQVSSRAAHYIQSLPGTAAVTLEVLTKMKPNEWKVLFSPETIKALKDGSAELVRSGEATLAIARKVSTGKTLEVGKVAGGTAAAVSMPVAVILVVVQLANIISAADTSKRLTEVNGKLDLMLQYRDIDQKAKLEGIYYAVQQLTSDTSISPNSQTYLDRVGALHNELDVLRATWKGEIYAHIGTIKNPNNRGVLNSITTWSSTIEEKNKAARMKAASRLLLIDYSLRLDRVLLAEIEDWKTTHQSLPFHIEETKKTVVQLVESSRYLESPNQHGHTLDLLRLRQFGRAMYERLGAFNPDIEADVTETVHPAFKFTSAECLKYIFTVGHGIVAVEPAIEEETRLRLEKMKK